MLSSFAWANVYPVATYSHVPEKLGIQADYWASVEKGAAHLSGFKNVYEIFLPKIVILMYKNCNLNSYFDGYQLEIINKTKGAKTDTNKTPFSYKLRTKGEDVDVLHLPHPRYIATCTKTIRDSIVNTVVGLVNGDK